MAHSGRPAAFAALGSQFRLEALRSGGFCCPRPHRYLMTSSDFRSALAHFAVLPLIGFAFTGHHGLATRSRRAGAETDLSCSVMGCVVIPLPIRHRVLRRCISRVLTSSMAFAHLRRARLPLSPYLRRTEPVDAAGFLVVRTDHLLAPRGDFVVALR